MAGWKGSIFFYFSPASSNTFHSFEGRLSKTMWVNVKNRKIVIIFLLKGFFLSKSRRIKYREQMQMLNPKTVEFFHKSFRKVMANISSLRI